mgnify:FL=1
MAEQQIKGVKINGTEYSFEDNSIGVIKSSNGTEFNLKVDNNGNLYTEKIDTAAGTLAKPADGRLKNSMEPKLYINEVYCGGIENDEHSVGFCSHNFVELANLSGKDINLKGLSLQYSTEGNAWKSLPLEGVIKNGSTFLVRGAQCAAMDGAKIKVLDYDMEWYENNEPFAFSDEKAKFFLRWGTEPTTATEPLYQKVGTKDVSLENGYISLAGFNVPDNESEGTAYKTTDMRDKLFKRYYAMDPVSQATKSMDKRGTATDWNYVDLTKADGEVIPNIEDYTPMATRDKKDIFYNKTKLFEDKPSLITCSFGIQATDNGKGATRCFNWLSKGVRDEYIWIRSKGTEEWGAANESFKNLSSDTDKTLKYYNRISIQYTDGTVFTAHKFIKSGLTKGAYEYIAGRKDNAGNPVLSECTPIRTFEVKSDTDVANGFNFVQTSDQQGFNWDEYQVWAAAAREITRFTSDNSLPFDFMVNTGDMTQNGNRMGEWLDYFNAKSDELNGMVEMATIGNNDLSPSVIYKLGDGSDAAKLNLQNILFFYTFEMDKDNPPVFSIQGADYLVPSLYSFNYGKVHFICMNSELKATAEDNPGKDCVYNFGSTGNFYPHIKAWAENDIKKYTGYTWNIAYCHEMPFTILVADIVNKAKDNKLEESTGRGGASMNTNTPSKDNYWFSEFCQKNNIPLVFGGHKHTQATSYPILENVTYDGETRSVESYRPIVVVDETVLQSDFASNSLVQVGNYKYPNNWVEGGALKAEFADVGRLSTFKLKSELEVDTTPVTYAMSQATGYKHTSNKELPSPHIPWLRYYYPANNGKVNSGQKFPFYTVWSITDEKIEGRVRKVNGAFNGSGKFDINIDGKYTLKDNSAVAQDGTTKIESKNGLVGTANGTERNVSNNAEIIKITK